MIADQVAEDPIALFQSWLAEAGESDVRGGEAVLSNGTVIGVTTSGGYGHATRKSLGFAYVDPGFVEPGSSFDVMLLGKRHKATVLGEPVYDPKNERPRA